MVPGKRALQRSGDTAMMHGGRSWRPRRRAGAGRSSSRSIDRSGTEDAGHGKHEARRIPDDGGWRAMHWGDGRPRPSLRMERGWGACGGSVRVRPPGGPGHMGVVRRKPCVLGGAERGRAASPLAAGRRSGKGTMGVRSSLARCFGIPCSGGQGLPALPILSHGKPRVFRRPFGGMGKGKVLGEGGHGGQRRMGAERMKRR